MKTYELTEDFGGFKAGDKIETSGEIGEYFAPYVKEAEPTHLEVATPRRKKSTEQGE
jgi:hypothetical protein